MSGLSEYPHVLPIVTRWKDNDVYGHVNNVEYYSFFDTVINAWLIAEGGLDIHGGDVIGVWAEAHRLSHAPLAFPPTGDAGLRGGKLGRSSVRYELALFGDGDAPAATGWFVHVFVDRRSRRPVEELPQRLRGALQRLVVEGTAA